ncbi:DNA repair protein [Peniophora sp. CONT]|nr:DNA repair protein [Peniophora sp. CONT]
MAALSADDSFDYFGSEDSAFLRELQDVQLPGDARQAGDTSKPSLLNPDSELDQSGDSDLLPRNRTLDITFGGPPCAQPSKRRRLSDTPPVSPLRSHDPPAAKRPRHDINLSIFADLSSDISFNELSPPLPQSDADPAPVQLPSQVQSPRKAGGSNTKRNPNSNGAYNALQTDDDNYLGEDIYGAAHFGDFGEYMRRKRAKLQIQNTELDEGTERNQIFRGVSIYINGRTKPSVQELRKLIVDYGGVFQAYLDKKALVTHVITCSLTPAKVREFQHMKVVRPEWLVDSVQKGALLPWHDYIFQTGGRIEGSMQGRTMQPSMHTFPAQRAQTSAQGFASSRAQSTMYGVQTTRASTSGRNYAASKRPRSPSPDADYGFDESFPDDDWERSFDADEAGLPPVYRIPQWKSTIPAKPATKPVQPPPASKAPVYANGPNTHAARAMQDPAWRAAHTSVAPGFIEGYYRNSRLHYLSTWKTELRVLVADAQDRAERGDVPGVEARLASQGLSMRGAKLTSPKGKGRAREGSQRVIMHVDFDAFFVSVGLLDRPEMRGKPVVVCHSQGGAGGASSTSEIASASYEAREFGIKNGMSLQQARQLCPSISTIPYEFEKYKKLSLKFYTILMSVADDLQAVSVDEALIDVTSSVEQMVSSNPAKDFAESVRAQVKEATGCTVSIGIAHNIMMARLATRKAKPAGSFHLTEDEIPALMGTLDIKDLHGFGSAACDKAQEKLGSTNLGELAKRSRGVLCDALGKGTGETLWKAIRGIDERKLESDKPRKSVSCEINYGIRFEDNEQAERFVHQMAEEVTRRLQAINKKGRSLTLKVMQRDPEAPVEAPKFMGHGICITHNRQSPLSGALGRATDDSNIIGALSWKLLRSMNIPPQELRGLGIQIQKLDDEVVVVPAGQGRLQFKSKDGKSYAGQGRIHDPLERLVAELDVLPTPAAMPPPHGAPATRPDVDLPNLSQLDQSVYNALPDDIRAELSQEYKRRSVTPAPGHNAAREPSAGPSNVGTDAPAPNLARITRALAPRSRPHISPQKRLYGLLARPAQKVKIPPPRVDEAELVALGLDPGVFAVLPVKIQREQLAQARGVATRLSQRPAEAVKPLKAPKKLGERFRYFDPLNEIIPPPPPPFAVHVELPTLRKPKKNARQVQEDAQALLAAWLQGFQAHVPHRRDVDHFAKYLSLCVESDLGIEQATALMRWWRILLRRSLGLWEGMELDEDVEQMLEEWVAGNRTFEGVRVSEELLGCAWWVAFEEIKCKMNEVARKRYGGSLSFR